MLARLVRLTAPLLAAAVLAATAAVFAAEVTADGSQRYQTIEGFGTCLIAWVDRFRWLVEVKRPARP